MSTTSATVETLTAEVRVLMVGNRQVTLSVYRQLDEVRPEAIEPFGRVRSGEKWQEEDGFGGRDEVAHIAVVGRVRDGYEGAGELVRSRVRWEGRRCYVGPGEDYEKAMADHQDRERLRRATVTSWRQLPLIILAGLR